MRIARLDAKELGTDSTPYMIDFEPLPETGYAFHEAGTAVNALYARSYSNVVGDTQRRTLQEAHRLTKEMLQLGMAELVTDWKADLNGGAENGKMKKAVATIIEEPQLRYLGSGLSAYAAGTSEACAAMRRDGGAEASAYNRGIDGALAAQLAEQLAEQTGFEALPPQWFQPGFAAILNDPRR